MSLTLELRQRPTLALEVKEIAAFLAEESKAREEFRNQIHSDRFPGLAIPLGALFDPSANFTLLKTLL